MTQATVMRKRTSDDRKRRYCMECGEIIKPHQQFVQIEDGFEHDFCAGMAGQIASCPECFMVAKDCTC